MPDWWCPVAKLSTLVDAFTDSTVNTSRWNASTAGQYTLDTVNDLVTLNVPTSAGSNNLGSGGPYDATSSSLYAQITPAANGNGGVSTILKLDAGSNNSVLVQVSSGGAFVLKLVTAGVSATTTLPTYDPHQHRWWQLSESAGVFTFAASPDSFTWTALATASHAWSATACQVYFQALASGTEVAGNVAAIENVNTRLGGQYNPAWPLVEDAWGAFWGANSGSFPLDRFVEVTDRTRQTVSVSRGRQYELDQVRSGEASMTLANTDAALDPVNTSGPWYGHIAPYQPYRRRAQWPATRNLFDQVQATGGDLGGYAAGAMPDAVDIYSDTDSGDGTITASATAWQGASVFQFAVPNATAVNQRIFHTPRFSVIPGQQYTVQFRVRNVTASTSLSVKAHLGWYTAGGGSSPTSFAYGSTGVLAGSATAGWTAVTVTATAPAGAAGINAGVSVAVIAAAACSVQADGGQLEKGAVSSTWAAPGVWNPVYAGWTERWPSQWDMSGTYGIVQPTAVDTFSLLSQQQLSDPLTMELNSNSPRFVYRLDDPAASVAVTDWMGANPAAQLAISKYGAGSLVFGTAITAADATGVYTGSSGTVATFSNANPGTSTIGPATFIKLSSAGIIGPANLASWTRMIAFRYTGPTPVSAAVFASGFDGQRAGGAPSGSGMYWQIDSTGKVGLVLRGPGSGGSGTLYAPGPTVLDSDWHLVFAAYDRASATLRIGIDGTSFTYSSIPTANEPSGLISDNVGAYVDPTVGNGTYLNYKGDLSFVAEFPTQLSGTAMNNIYTAWKSAASGESSNARYARILRYAGYSGASTLQTGLTTSMGPATIDGQDAMSALQAIVDTENGAHYVATDGTVTFRSRSARYNALTPMYTFGENAGEWPYEDVTLDYDSTHLSNQVTVTQESSGQNFYATDNTSLANYFPRTLSRTINASDVNECQDAANYLLSRYKAPATRVSSIKLHPSAMPALWPVCLSLELGTRVRVMRRPPGLPAIQVDCFVENIQADFGDDGEAWYTLQCSPADLTPYGIFAAWHTTLHTTIASGVSSITVDASQDTVNPLAAQLAAGQQIVLGQNSANQETVTIASVGATSSGWTTATITLTAVTTKGHTAGDVVCQVLPAGTTDPTTWDQVSKFDSIAFAY